MSTWKSKKYTLESGKVTEIYFEKNPQFPNCFYLVNYGGSDVFVGADRVPTNSNFDCVVNAKSTEILARPFHLERLYCFNESDKDIDILVYSDTQDFDFSLLKSKMECYITGVKKGSQIDVINENLEKLGACVVDNKLSVENELVRMLFYQKIFTGDETTAEPVKTFKEINFVTNDGENDIQVNFNGISVRLRKGESINNFMLAGNNFSVSGTDAKFRYLIRG